MGFIARLICSLQDLQMLAAGLRCRLSSVELVVGAFRLCGKSRSTAGSEDL